MALVLIPFVQAELGIDFNAEGNYYDLHNDYHHYFIDAETGIDLTNDFYAFWSKKEFCLEAKKGPNIIRKCTEEIPLIWITEENEFYVKLIGKLNYNFHSTDINLVYYLGEYDGRITVTPQIRATKNLDYIKFSVKDYNIRASRDYENDYFKVDYPYYEEYPISNGNYTEYSNVLDNYYHLYDLQSNGNIDFWWDNEYYLDGEYLEWVDENLTAAFNLSREKDFVSVELTTGEIPKNKNFKMNFYWVDGLCRAVVGMNVIPAMFEGDQESVQCTWTFTGSEGCPDHTIWQTNEGVSGEWITLPNTPGDENSFGLNCGADIINPKEMPEISYNSFYLVGSCIVPTNELSGASNEYVNCGDDSNISNHLARCALYRNGAYVNSSIYRTAICMEEITLGITWIKPYFSYTEHGTDQNIIIKATTSCTKGFCGDTNSFIQWCEGEDCNDWQDVNSSSGKIILITGNNPLQEFDLNQSDSYDLNWAVKINQDSNEIQTFDLRIKALSEFAPQKNSSSKTITTGYPPTTSIDVNEFWQSFDANIHLNCYDGNGSGCNKKHYRIDLNPSKDTNYADANFTEYDSNVLISQDGNIGIQFYSIDNANNEEEIQEAFALIDKTTHTLLTENFLPQPSNAAKNYVKLSNEIIVIGYCYYNNYCLGDAYYVASANGIAWTQPIQINSDSGYCSGYYNENGTPPYRTGEGGITLTRNSLNNIFFLFSEWNGIKAWTKTQYSGGTWSDTTLINGNAGNNPNKDTLNITTDSNNSINYIITQKSS